MKHDGAFKTLKIGRFINSEIELKGLLLGELQNQGSVLKFVLEQDKDLEIYHAFTCALNIITEHKQATSLKQLLINCGFAETKDILTDWGFPTETPIDLKYSDITANNYKVLNNPYGEPYIYSEGEVISQKSVINDQSHKIDLTIVEKPDGKHLMLVINHHDKTSYVYNLSNDKSLELVLRQQHLVTEA